MTNLIERLMTAVVTEVNPDDGKTYTTKLGEEAAVEIAKWRALASDWRRACVAAYPDALEQLDEQSFQRLKVASDAAIKLQAYVDEVSK
jgi:hypothetical protein